MTFSPKVNVIPSINSESYDILSLLSPYCSSYLGIGVQEGNCVLHVIQANPQIKKLILCDTWGPHHGGTNRGNPEHVFKKLDSVSYAGDIVFLNGSSAVLIPQLNDSVDLSYVDGDHGEEAAYNDLINVWPRTNKAMVVHDTKFPSVWSALTRFLDQVENGIQVCCNGGTGTAVIYR